MNLKQDSDNKRMYLLGGLAVVLALAIAGVFGYNKFLGNSGGVSAPKLPTVGNSSVWAVFLTNGQTYFGKLNPGDLAVGFVELSEVYYLEKNATPAPTKDATGREVTPSSATPGYTLVHLGSELHGPTDKMLISSQNVLFVEQLKGDSKVVKAIEDAKKQQQ